MARGAGSAARWPGTGQSVQPTLAVTTAEPHQGAQLLSANPHPAGGSQGPLPVAVLPCLSICHSLQ